MNRLIWVALICLSFGSGAVAEAPSGAWQTYRNERFGFSLSYPAATFKEDRASQGGDGILFADREGKAKLLVGVLRNTESYTPKTYQDFIARRSYAGYAIDYKDRGGSWFALSGDGHGTTFYEKVLFTCAGRWITSFAMLYPTAERSFFDPIVERMEDSFAAGTTQCGSERKTAATEGAPTQAPRTGRRGPYGPLADRIARARGQNVIVIMRRRGPPYDYRAVRGYASR